MCVVRTDSANPGWVGPEDSIMAHSPHRRWKGCALCAPHKTRGNGRSVRDPFNVNKKIGKLRRTTRHDLGDQSAED